MSKHRRSTNEWPFAIPFVILGVCAFLIATDTPFVEKIMRPATFDTYQQIEHDVSLRREASGRPPATNTPATDTPATDTAAADAVTGTPTRTPADIPEVVYLEIDPEQSKTYSSWPWPRNALAQLTHNLHLAGAEIIVFDTVFDEPDQQSPDLLLDSLWQDERTKSLVGPLSMLPDHDALLAAAFRETKVVASFYGRDRETSDSSATPPFAPTPVAVFNAAAADHIRHFPTAVYNIPVLATAAAGNGANTVTFSKDWIVRELPLIVKVGDTLLPTQIAETIRLAEGADRIYLETAATNESARLSAARIGERTIPVSPNGGVWLNLADTPLVRTLDAVAYLDPKPADASVRHIPHNPHAVNTASTVTRITADSTADSGEAATDLPANRPAGVTAIGTPESGTGATTDNTANDSFIEEQGSGDGTPIRVAALDATADTTANATAKTAEQGTPDTAAPQIPAREDLDGKIVFVGPKSDPGKEQTRLQIRTALHDDISATQLKATIVQQILNGSYLHRPLWAKNAEIAGLVVIGLILCGLAILAPLPAAIIAGLLLLSGLLGSGWYVYRQDNMLLDMTTPTLAAALSFLTALFVTIGYRRQGDIVVKTPRRQAYTPPRAPTPKFSQPKALTPPKIRVGPKPANKIATLMVCNIKGLSELEERFTHDPAGLNNLMEEFVAKLTEQVSARNGQVLHVVGDQIIASWNLDQNDSEHHAHACDCALRFLEVLDDLNETLEDQAHLNKVKFDPIRLNIGINTGRAKTNMVGAKIRGASSVSGEAKDTADWFAQRAEHYGPAVIVGEDTYLSAQLGFAMLEIDLISVADRPDPYRVFALLGNPVAKASPQFREIEKAHAAFFAAFRKKQWSKAWELVQSTRQMSGAMPKLYTLYEGRIQHYMKNPPPQDWTGEYIEPIK